MPPAHHQRTGHPEHDLILFHELFRLETDRSRVTGKPDHPVIAAFLTTGILYYPIIAFSEIKHENTHVS